MTPAGVLLAVAEWWQGIGGEGQGLLLTLGVFALLTVFRVFVD